MELLRLDIAGIVMVLTILGSFISAGVNILRYFVGPGVSGDYHMPEQVVAQ